MENDPSRSPADRNEPEPVTLDLAQAVVAGSLRGISLDATHVTVSKTVIPPHGSTGWHYHPGPVLVLVAGGTLTHTYADGSTDTVGAGSCFVELSGPENAHVGVNPAAFPLVLHAVYFLPDASSPRAVPVPEPH
ncbi:cupin domain-containing protein [Streptomyces sp. S584]|uniref:cupin domain-containing protein n=1 Tax=Streptomyces sp. S584 TaxID=3096010 RepID=UPI002AFDE0ED|nr:cupin domain-containing protein [Streptomyces sp. S584]